MPAAPEIKPYKISVEQSKLDILQKKLEFATFPDELDEAAWDYGAPLADIKRLAEYWKTSFDWRTVESKINSDLKQFTIPIEVEGFGTLQIHFVHHKSEVHGATPLLFVHGWPGSFLEVSRIVEGLTKPTDPEQPAFHVVAPSLANFGFSEGVKMKGFDIAQQAEICQKLMLALGYNQYVTQGGDIGTFITRFMGLLYPFSVKASHINMPQSKPPSLIKQPLLALQHLITPWTAREKAGVGRIMWFLKNGSGYVREQSTKPQTLGYSLTDSPVGLLAWIYEKLHDWTDNYQWTDEEIITWISIYWFSTAGPAASLRIYYECLKENSLQITLGWIPRVPLGIAYFPKELMPVPRTWARTLGPIIFESEHESGGHFAAWERPEAIVADMRTMFGKTGPAYGVVRDKDGYGVVSELEAA